MSNLICPFCKQEMIIPKDEVRKGIQCCVCRNPKCEFDGWHFPVKLVSELIRTRKALDVALKRLNGVVKDLPWIKRTLDEITALEQKDK